jgi:UDP-glucose 4,6-dehydratase
MPIIITRGNNVYGINQYPEKLIPLFIDLLLANKPVTIQGDGSNVRAFLHVDDVCTALKLVLEKGQVGEIYNIGSDEHDEYSVLEIARMLVSKIHNTDDTSNMITYIKDRPFNDKRYYISNEKVKKLGWEIATDFNKGIDNLIIQRSIIYHDRV